MLQLTGHPSLLPGEGAAPGNSRHPYLAILIAFFLAVSFTVLLPVLPILVVRHGRPGDAGAATAALLAMTVLGELAAPMLMARFSPRWLVAAGMLLASLPTGLYLVPQLGVVQLLLATAFRGAGFGFAGVACMAVAAGDSRPDARGTLMGLYGAAFTAPLLVFPPLGLFLFGIGLGWLDVAFAGLSGLVAAVLAFGLSGGQSSVSDAGWRTRSWRPIAATLLTLSVVNMTFGGVVSFVPVALPLNGLASATTFLLGSGIARMAGRLVSGVAADRVSAQTVVLVGAAATAAGLVALPFGDSALPVLLGASLYGIGAGAIQTATFVAMVGRDRVNDVRVLTTAWNVAVDTGTGTGAAALGLVAAALGYHAVLVLLPAVAALAIPTTLLAMRAGRAAS